MAVCPGENMNLEKQEGFMDGPLNPLAVNLTRNTLPLMGEAGVLLLSEKEAVIIRISHSTKKGHQETEWIEEMWGQGQSQSREMTLSPEG